MEVGVSWGGFLEEEVGMRGASIEEKVRASRKKSRAGAPKGA